MHGLVAYTDPSRHRIEATSAMIEDILLPFSFPAVGRKKITAAFDGGRITSDFGVMLLGQAERRLGVADKLAAVIADPRNPLLITHSLGSIFRARILAIACVLSDATISSTFSIGHCGRNDGFRSAPLDAPPPPSNRPCASSRKRRSSGPASEPTAQKSAKSS